MIALRVTTSMLVKDVVLPVERVVATVLLKLVVVPTVVRVEVPMAIAVQTQLEENETVVIMALTEEEEEEVVVEKAMPNVDDSGGTYGGGCPRSTGGGDQGGCGLNRGGGVGREGGATGDDNGCADGGGSPGLLVSKDSFAELQLLPTIDNSLQDNTTQQTFHFSLFK
ncbi:unnamed protein product [Ilex paraguariensis]|uniref:Uncharacterized protein n=1 Tax=Ilex paraguariensis TaxID=185542 RepID=A0ABC8V3S0_9AQUA